jgi:hypothetical protein
MWNEQARSIFADRAFAHLAVCADGRPHNSAVWVDVDEQGRIVCNTALGRVKDRLLQVGVPVAFSATRPGNDYEQVTVTGIVVERTTRDADAVIDALARKYLGAETYPFRRPGEQRLTIRVQPDPQP